MNKDIIKKLKETKEMALNEIGKVNTIYEQMWQEVTEKYYNYVVKSIYDDPYFVLTAHPKQAKEKCGVILNLQGERLLNNMLTKDGFDYDEPFDTYAIKPSIIEDYIEKSNEKNKSL